MNIALIVVGSLAFILVEILLGYLLEKYGVIDKFPIWLIGGSLVVLVLTGAWLTTVQPNPDFDYIVKITDGETTQPLVKAMVELGEVNTETYYRQETDSIGETYFKVPRTVAGQWVSLRVVSEGYGEWVQRIKPTEQESRTTIALQPNQPSDPVPVDPTQTAVPSTETPLPLETAQPTTQTAVPATETPLPTETPLVLGIGSTRVVTTGMVQVYVPAGEFSMGSNDGDDEKPVHAVYLDAYWLDQTEVTNAHYVAFLNALPEGDHETGCLGESCIPTKAQDDSSQIVRNERYEVFTGYEQHPVNNVSWYGAVAFCEWRGARLPTEAEWEKAARWDVSTQTALTYPWGDEINCDYLNYRDGNDSFCVGGTTPVGSYKQGKSPYNAFDMAGNLWEWTLSLYKPYPYNANDGRNDTTTTGSRLVRGGSWGLIDSFVRSAYRSNGSPDSHGSFVGFRCVQE